MNISLYIFLLCLVPDESSDRSLVLGSGCPSPTVTWVGGLTVSLSFLELDLWVFLEAWVRTALLQRGAMFASARCQKGLPLLSLCFGGHLSECEFGHQTCLRTSLWLQIPHGDFLFLSPRHQSSGVWYRSQEWAGGQGCAYSPLE